MLPLAFETSGYMDKDNWESLRRIILAAFPSPTSKNAPLPREFVRHMVQLRTATSIALCRSNALLLSHYCRYLAPEASQEPQGGVGAAAGQAGQGM